MKIKQAYDDYLVTLTRDQAQEPEPRAHSPVSKKEEPNELQ